jgi:ketosteroid isomerase-like protein
VEDNMRSRTLLASVLALLATAACQTGVAPLTEEDITANRALTDQFIQAANANDWAAIAELYTEDCIVMPANAPIVEGRDGYLAWGETFPPLAEFSGVIESIEGYGDLAVIRGSYSMSMQMEGDEPVLDQGKYVEIRRKQPDGSWLIAIDIFNSDLPLPGAL